MTHYCTKPFEKAWNTTALTLVVLDTQLNQNVMEKRICSGWAGGLTPREAARGAFQLDYFQNMDDPLGDPDPAVYGDLVKEVSYS